MRWRADDGKDNYSRANKATMISSSPPRWIPKVEEVYNRLDARPGVLKALIYEVLILDQSYIDYAEGDVLTLYKAVDNFNEQFRDLSQPRPRRLLPDLPE